MVFPALITTSRKPSQDRNVAALLTKLCVSKFGKAIFYWRLKMKKTIFAKDFSKHPLGRFKKDGNYSGELFREKVLIPIMLKKENVILNLDGVRGYSSAFLDEAFGGLAKIYDIKNINKLIKLESRDKLLIMRIDLYMQNLERPKLKTN